MIITEQKNADRALQFGCPTLLGTLTSTGSTVNNTTTAVPFNWPAGGFGTTTLANKALLIVASAAGYVIPVTTAAGTAASTTAIYLNPNDPKSFKMTESHLYLAWISVTGTAALLVFELN